MTSPILFAGGEDLSFNPIGSSYSTGASGPISIDTTSGRFRSGYARYSISIGVNGSAGTLYARGLFPATTQFWHSARMWGINAQTLNVNNSVIWRWIDSSGVIRLRIRNTSAGNSGPWAVEKISAANVITQLGSSFSSVVFSTNPTTPDKLDVFINYAVSGTFTLYINGTVAFTFSGDVTTDSATALGGFDLGSMSCGTVGTVGLSSWSEVVVATQDTRAISVVTQAPSASGNTDTFTNGAFGNVNGNLVNQATPDYSQTAAQIQQYQVGQAIPSGSFTVISVVQHGQCIAGPSGPGHIEFGVRTGSTDFFTADMTPTLAWGLLTANWDTNPNTSAPWALTDLANGSTSFNLGYKSTV